MEEHLDQPLLVRWRSFPLEQVNSQEEGVEFWEQSPDEAKSLRAFLAAEAARDQGVAVYREFVFALLHTVHAEKKPVQDMTTIREAASQVTALDVGRLERDMENPELRQRIARDYREAANEYGIFGTPTLLWADGDPVFLKMAPPAPRDQAYSLLTDLRTLSLNREYVLELKKPRRPERPA